MENSAVPANYIEQKVLDYCGNPLIEALPPIYTKKYDVMRALTTDPVYSESEREDDAERRVHCIGRLFRYFQPLTIHFSIERKISLAIRQSYISKNPATPKYAVGLAEGAEAMRQNNLNALSASNSTAFSFTIIGMSGVGKGLSIRINCTTIGCALKNTAIRTARQAAKGLRGILSVIMGVSSLNCSTPTIQVRALG